MKKRSARCEVTDRALRDIERGRQFLRRRLGNPRGRIRDVVNAIRFIQEYPQLRPVEGTSLIGLALRRRKAGQFVIVYSYFEPSSSDPEGFVSVRAVRHAFYGVEESGPSEDPRPPSFLRLE